MSIGKSLRFEIFARDGFTCQYCGRRPPDVILEVDHIHPESKGGTADPINLITACFDCNRGKSAKVISEIAPRPDADLTYLKVQQELAEAKRYLEAKQVLDALLRDVAVVLKQLWAEQLTSDRIPDDRQFSQWLNRYSPEEVDYAIRAASGKFHRGQFGRTYRWDTCQAVSCYISGIMRSRAKQSAEKAASAIQ